MDTPVLSSSRSHEVESGGLNLTAWTLLHLRSFERECIFGALKINCLTLANPFQEQHQRRSVGCVWSNILYMTNISHPLKYLQT